MPEKAYAHKSALEYNLNSELIRILGRWSALKSQRLCDLLGTWPDGNVDIAVSDSILMSASIAVVQCHRTFSF